MIGNGGRAIDVSVTIRPAMPVYPGDPGVAIELARAIDRGDAANVSRLDIGAHTGTHVDAPRHFVAGGAAADELTLEPFVGPCVVADATHAAGPLDAAFVDGLDLPAGCERLLLKTANSRLWERDEFDPGFVRLDLAGARALIARGLALVGIDYLSIGDRDVHLVLLGGGVGVVEGLDLGAVEPGPYVMACLPLKIGGCDGAPARALLWHMPP